MALWMWWCDWNMLQKKSLIFTGLSHEYMKQQSKTWLDLHVRPTTNSASFNAYIVYCIMYRQYTIYNISIEHTMKHACTHRYTCVYTEYTLVNMGIHKYTQIYVRIHEYTQVYTGTCMHEYIGVYMRYIQEYTGVYMSTHEYTWVYTSIPRIHR